MIISEDFAKTVYERGFSFNQFNYKEILSVGMLFYWKFEYKGKKLKDELLNFCYKNDEFFNKATYINTMRSVLSNIKRKNFDVLPPPITITENEINNIRKVKNFKVQKFLFSILVEAKRNKFKEKLKKDKLERMGYFVYKNFALKTWKSLGRNISLNKFEIDVMKPLISSNIIHLNDNQSNIFFILYSEDNSRPLVEVKPLDIPSKIFFDFEGGKEYIFCDICGEKEEKRSNRHKLCKKHYVEKEKLRKR